MKIFLSIFIIINFLYANKTIKAVIPANFLPYYSVDKDGTVSGFAVDVLNEVAKNSNFKVEYIVKDSFSSASDYLLEGKADLIPNSGISKNRMKNSIFTTPMDTFNIKAFKRKVTTTISNLDDIKDKKIVIVKSNIGARLMKNHPSDLTTTVNSPEEAIFLLITGQVDVLVFPEIIINNLLKQLDLSDKVVSFGKPLKEIKRAIRVHKSQANLAQKLDKELRKFLKTKEYQKIYTKWFKNNMIEIEESKYKQIQFTILALFILLFLFIYFLIKTKKLKNEIENVKYQFENMFKTHDAIMLLVDPTDGRILEANHSARNFYGYSKEEFKKLYTFDINLLNKNEIKEEIQNAKKFNQNKFEFQHKLKDGTIKDVSIHSSPIKTNKGQLLFSIIRDITLEKRYKEKLIKKDEELEDSNHELQVSLEQLSILSNKEQKEKEKLSRVIRYLPDLLWIKDIDGKYLACNKRFEDFFGATEEEIKGKSDYDFVNKELADFFIQNDKKAMNSNTPVTNLEEVTFASDNHKEYLHTTKVKILNDDNTINGVVGIARDITDIKNYQETIKEQKEEFESIFKNSKDGIAILDLDTKFLDFNDAYLKMLGYTEDELKKKTCIELSTPKDREKSIKAIQIGLKKGFIENFEKECLTKDKRRITVNMTASLLPDKKRFLIIAKNVSSLKTLEEQSKLASMGEMIGNIAHQWRQPLSIITTAASGLAIKSDFDEDISKEDISNFANKIETQATYLSNTIDDFKNFLKDNKNYLPISIHDVIKGSLSLTDASRKEHFIKLIEDFDDDLIIKGNINELEQSIINILNNAKDSLTSNKNLKNKYIFISTKKTDENHIKIKILDNGGGIKEDILSRIFEPYFTTKHQSIGTGLGLSMVDKIVRERHQGIIKAYNEEYNYNGENFKGACFVITLNNITI